MFGNKMKGLVAIALVLAVAVPVFASPDAKLTISATMPLIQMVTFESKSLAKTVTVDDISNTSLIELGKIFAYSNSKKGYKVSVSSKNGGKLTSAEGSDITYLLKVNNSETLSLTTNETVITTVNSKTTKNGVESTLAAELQGSSTDYFDAGTYVDELTISIAAL